MKTNELRLIAEKNRKRLVEVVYQAKAGHIGGDLSCLNVMTALYFHVMNIDHSSLNVDHSSLTIDHSSDTPTNVLWSNRDRFVLSKGHCVEALYVTLEAADIEESLHPWDKAHLIMVYDLFNVLLDSDC